MTTAGHGPNSSELPSNSSYNVICCAYLARLYSQGTLSFSYNKTIIPPLRTYQVYVRTALTLKSDIILVGVVTVARSAYVQVEVIIAGIQVRVRYMNRVQVKFFGSIKNVRIICL